jgi:hypothetical protein
LVLAGCGGDSEGGGSPRPTATTTAPPTAAVPARTHTAAPTPTPTGGGGELDIAVCAPGAAPFSASITHPFFPMPVGARWVLVGESDGAPLRVVITALADTAVVAGVTTRVIEEREWEDGELVEVSRNFFAQAGDGTLCYYGEDVDDYEAGQVVGHDGAWRAGVDGALPGILLPAMPQVGQRFRQEVAIGVAEDRAEQVAANEPVTIGLGTFTDTIRYEERSPLDSGTSEKIYGRGVGLLVDDEIARIPENATHCGTVDGQGCAPESRRVDLAAPVFSNPTAVTNPLFPVSRQHSVVMLGTVDGEPFRAEVTLLPQPKMIPLDGQPIATLESQYVAFVDGRLHEVALDWYGQDDSGAVWYFGEDVFNYEDGALADTSGTWQAGREGPVAMIMPGAPRVDDVYRPENIPGLVFEEVTVGATGVTVAGPYGPIAGAIEVDELHLDGGREAKTFAPGYGEFFTGGGDSEALALAVPTDALAQPLPRALADLASAAEDAFDAAEEEDWPAASAARDAAMQAWQAARDGNGAPLLAAALDRALAALEEAIDAEESIDGRQAAIDLARATLDIHLRYRPSTDVDRARFALWARQVLIDAEDEDAAAVRGDAVAMSWVLARFAHTLSAAEASAVGGHLDTLSAAAAADNLPGAAAAAAAVRDALGV